MFLKLTDSKIVIVMKKSDLKLFLTILKYLVTFLAGLLGAESIEPFKTLF